MNIFNLLFNWCAQEGVKGVFHLVKSILDILRYAVPIILIAMTSLDIAKKVINPDEKDGQKKIMTRLIAAVIVFFIPFFIKLVFGIIDWGMERSGSYNESESRLSSCWN